MQWDPADFRERIQTVLDAFLDEPMPARKPRRSASKPAAKRSAA